MCLWNLTYGNNFLDLQGQRKSLADKFEYVMHGKLYKISEESSGPNVKVYAFCLLFFPLSF